MMKRIKSAQLRPGMYLQKLEGNWMAHPFWRSSFMLKHQGQVEEILASGIPEVWIDTGKGQDVDCGPSQALPPAVPKEVVQTPPARAEMRVPMAEELARAASICSQSKKAIVSMFQDVRMGKAIAIEGARPLVEEIADSVARNPSALISVARLKTADDYTYMHSVAVCGLMIALANELGMDETSAREAGLAGLLHDVGKMAVPNEILNKPGKLTNQEFDIVRGHPERGHRILVEGGGASEVALDVCLHHHEKVDGSGYPDRLDGSRISQFAKMGAVCDVYDAITSNRPYKSGWNPAEALSKMTEWSKGHFEETVFLAFVKCVGIYPVGSFVRLGSGRLGVVAEQSEKSLLKPVVRVFFSTRSGMRIPHELVDLGRPGIGDAIADREDPARWDFPDLEDLWRPAELL
jgi:putative nucleotidyltransferase with HDIG domain